MTLGPNYWKWHPGDQDPETDLTFEGPRVLVFKAPPFGVILDLLDGFRDASEGAPKGGLPRARAMLPTYESILKATVWPRIEGEALPELQETYTFVEIIQAVTAAVGGLHEQVAFLPLAESKAAKDLPFTEPPRGGSSTS